MKHGISLPNTPATIDSDYRGEIRVPLINLGREPFTVSRGMRIAQFVVAPVARVTWDEVDGAAARPTAAGEVSAHSGVCYTFRASCRDSRSGRDSEARAVQGGRGVRAREGAAVRAAIVGSGISASWASRRRRARRASTGASDVEQVLRIKHLLLVEGLTLAGARRQARRGDGAGRGGRAGDRRADRPERARAADRGQARAAVDSRAADGHDWRRRVPSRAAERRRRAPSRVRPMPAARGQAVARQGAGARQRIGALSPSAPQAFGVRSTESGRSVAWLSRLTGGQEIGGSNPPVPTN